MLPASSTPIAECVGAPRSSAPDQEVIREDASVDLLLRQSRAFHAQYRAHANKRDYPALERIVAQALSTRQQAHDLDPEGTDAAWSADQAAMKGVLSADLLTFYKTYIPAPVTFQQSDAPVSRTTAVVMSVSGVVLALLGLSSVISWRVS